MATKTLPVVHKIYHMPKPGVFTRGVPSRLPDAYKKFYEEWIKEPSPVHYDPEPGKWKRDPLTGEVTPVQNVPIMVKYPKDCNTGIWGGEGVIVGYKKADRENKQKSTRWFMPNLLRTVVYSEILNKRFSVIVTKRTIKLIIEHHGFDNYLLETPPCDLKSLLALKLKKKLLLTLFDKTLYPDDASKQDAIYNKYKHHLINYNKDDLEWYALSLGEAVGKLQDMEDSVQPKPFKYQFRAELIEELKTMVVNEELDKFIKSKEEANKSWMKRINPFGNKSK